MTQPPPQASLNSSRLVRLLTELSVTNVNPSHKNFGDWLGGLLGFSDSIVLSATHGDMRAVAFEKRVTDADKAREELLMVRGALVENIIKSTTLGLNETRIKLPRMILEKEQTPKNLKEFEPFQRFYVAHQNEIKLKLGRLRYLLRDELSGYSKSLAQLAVLDQALEETLQVQTQKFFAVIPRLIKKRYRFLLEQHENALPDPDNDLPHKWMQPGGWMAQFCQELQGLLLAELEVRLQPLLGLLEAFNEEVSNNP